MKKILLMMLMVLITISVFGQTRKVAILETVDREGRIPYGVKLIIRSSLAKGVADTKGYEAFERTDDLRKIFDEQKFQLTGNVSDEEIRKIGEMTGVQYVLVAEASQVDSRKIYITAKVLNVETARVEMTDGLMMNNNVKAVQKGAKKLGASLLKPYYQQETKSKAQVQEQQEEQKAEEPALKPAADYLTIERISKDEYKYGDQWMTRMEYYKMINNRDLCIPAYQQFQKGLKLEKAGKWTLICGSGVLLIGTLVTAIGIPVNRHIYVETYYEPENPDYSYSWDRPSSGTYDGVYVNQGDWTRMGTGKYGSYRWYAYGDGPNLIGCEVSGPLFMGIGATMMITGGTLWGTGIKKKDNAYKAYNDHCAEFLSLNLIYSGNGLGLALCF